MIKARTYLYKNMEVSIKDIAELKKVSTPSIRALIKGTKPGSDVTNLVDNYTPRCRNRVFVYMDRKVTCSDLVRITGYPTHTIFNILRGVEPNTDVTAVMNGMTPIYRKRSFYVHGKLIKEADIHKKYNLNYRTLHNKFRDVEDGADVTSIVDDLLSRCKKTYIVFGEELTASEAEAKYMFKCGTLRNRVYRAKRDPGSDITDLVSRVVIKPMSTEHMLKLTGDKSVGGTGIEWSNSSAFAFLGYHRSERISYITKEVLLRNNYEGRKALGFDKACRSKWLTDNLWIYECPDCGKHLVLTTDEIVNHVHGDMCTTHSTEEVVDETLK